MAQKKSSYFDKYKDVEEEDYFFSTTVPLFSIAGVMPKTVQTYDTQRNFNQVDAGSETFIPDSDSTDIYYPQDRYTAWNKERYLGCGTCTGDRDNDLNLVSDYIIDSNVIYEALNWGATDYGYDDNIFLFNYTVSGADNIGVRTLSGGEYHYNDTLINENVLANWIDYYGSCLSVSRYANSGFRLEYIGYPLSVTGGSGSLGEQDFIEYATTGYDLQTAIGTYSGNVYSPANLLFPAGTVTATFKYFEAPIASENDIININEVAEFTIIVVNVLPVYVIICS